MTNEERAVELAMQITGRTGLSKEKHVDPILAYADEIRLAAGERADSLLHKHGISRWSEFGIRLRAAIMGKEAGE